MERHQWTVRALRAVIRTGAIAALLVFTGGGPGSPVAFAQDRDRDWEREQAEHWREERKAREEAEREWRKAQEEAWRESEKDRREAQREGEKDRREAWKEAEKDRREAEKERRKSGAYGSGYDPYYDSGRTYDPSSGRSSRRGAYARGSRGGYIPYSDNGRGRMDRSEVARRGAAVGYRDGYARGEYDRSRGVRRGNPQGHGAFEQGLDGWDSRWGSAETYRQSFRSAFLRGYDEGLRGGRRRY